MTMATVNFDVSTDWVRLAAADDDTLMISSRERTLLEFASTASTDPPDDVLGHLMAMGTTETLTRASGIVGHVWGRVVAGSPDTVLAVDGSSVTDDEPE